MKFLPLAVALVGIAGAHESGSSHSGKQTFVAHKMDPAPASNSFSKSAKTNPSHGSNSNKVSGDVKANVADSSDEDIPKRSPLERQPVEAQVVLSNVDMEDLSPEEIMYFESSLRKAIQLAQDQDPDKEDEVTIGAILVENGHGPHKNDSHNNNRALRGGGRETLSFSFFNIWALLETFRCRFCREYDDDDEIDHHEEWKKNRAKYFPSPAPTRAPTPRPTHTTDDDHVLRWEEMKEAYNNGEMEKAYNNGGGRRHLGVSESNTSLEDILCQLLREGPHESFHLVDECTLEVSKW